MGPEREFQSGAQQSREVIYFYWEGKNISMLQGNQKPKVMLHFLPLAVIYVLRYTLCTLYFPLTW